MNRSLEYGGIDCFRIVAAFLIVGIHTYPLYDINEFLNFGVINIFARIAVPFFLMVTGFFVLSNFLSEEKTREGFPIEFIKKTGLLYIGSTLLYLPVSIYAGYYSSGNILLVFARNFVFDGTLYHLWYLPASIIGMVLICTLNRKISFGAICGLSVALYVFGLLGDSYYGFTAEIPFLRTLFDIGFQIFSYTRNGLFYAPVFLVMGAAIKRTGKKKTMRAGIVGFTISMSLMLAEGFLLRHFSYQRHDSMYIALLPCMFFLFHLLLSCKAKPPPFSRDVSLWIYILHPLIIIVIRGAAKIIGLNGLLVENNAIHYLAVCLLSFAAAIIITELHERIKAS